MSDAIGLPYLTGPNGGVAFDYPVWAAAYPELSGNLPVGQAQSYFLIGQLYLDNSSCSAVTDLGIRSALMNMLVAHLAAMFNGVNGEKPSELVGRISAATQGSVSVTAEYAIPPSASAAWFTQTKYGAAYWQATSIYRRFSYVPGPQPFFQPRGFPYG